MAFIGKVHPLQVKMDEGTLSILFLLISHKYNRYYGGSNTQLFAMTSERVELLPEEKARLLYSL
jgi:hypothetical protein